MPVTFSSSYWNTPLPFIIRFLLLIHMSGNLTPTPSSDQPQGSFAGWDQPPLYSFALQPGVPEIQPVPAPEVTTHTYCNLESSSFQASSQEVKYSLASPVSSKSIHAGSFLSQSRMMQKAGETKITNMRKLPSTQCSHCYVCRVAIVNFLMHLQFLSSHLFLNLLQ